MDISFQDDRSLKAIELESLEAGKLEGSEIEISRR
jgi:hypothetical protein